MRKTKMKRFVTSMEAINFPTWSFDKELRKVLKEYKIVGIEVKPSKFDYIIAFNLCEKQQKRD